VPRPACQLNLASKLKDAANISMPELSFQCKALKDFHSHRAQDSHSTGDDHLPTSSAPDSSPQASLLASSVLAVHGKHSLSSDASDNASDIADHPKEQCVYLEAHSVPY
jgi:hypothetical protein